MATSLRRRLPATLAALEAGDIVYLQAAHLVSAVRELDDDAATAVEARVLGRAPEQTVVGVPALGGPGGDRGRPGLGGGPAQEGDQAARTIERMPELDGMESFWATMPASISRDIWAALTADAKAEQAARQQAGLPDPGIDALRLDVLVHAMLHNGGADPDDPLLTKTDAGHRPTTATAPRPAPAAGKAPKCSCGGAQSAAVVIDLATLLGLADHPGEIPGYGPIPAPMARAMAADRDWVRWTVDPATGQLLDRGATTYRPVGQAARVRRRPRPGLRLPRLQPARRTVRLRPHRHLRPPRPDHPRQPRTALPAAPQRQDPRTLETPLRPRHRHQDLDQPTGQDLHQEHRPTPDLGRAAGMTPLTHLRQCPALTTDAGRRGLSVLQGE